MNDVLTGVANGMTTVDPSVPTDPACTICVTIPAKGETVESPNAKFKE